MSQKPVAGFGVARLGRCKLTGQNIATRALPGDFEPMIAQNVEHVVRDVDDFRAPQLLKDRSAEGGISAQRGSIKNIGLADRRFRSRPRSQESINEEAEERGHGEVMVSAENSYAGQGRFPPTAPVGFSLSMARSKRSKPGTPGARYASDQPCDV